MTREYNGTDDPGRQAPEKYAGSGEWGEAKANDQVHDTGKKHRTKPAVPDLHAADCSLGWGGPCAFSRGINLGRRLRGRKQLRHLTSGSVPPGRQRAIDRPRHYSDRHYSLLRHHEGYIFFG